MPALQFPASPNDGDTYLDYVFDAAMDVWNKYAPDSKLSDVSDAFLPSIPDRSYLAYALSSEVWYADETPLVPAGVVMSYGGDSTPDGYLRCDGSVLSRTEYARLFAAIGTTYARGDETSTQFRLPSISGRLVVGLDSSQSEFNPNGKLGGSKTHQLSISEMPSHTHTQDAHTHSQNAHNHSQDGHSHGAGTPFSNAGSPWGLGYFGSFRGRVGVTGGWGLGTDGRQPAISSVAAGNQSTVAENEYTGGSQPHNNVQPYITLDYIIKY